MKRFTVFPGEADKVTSSPTTKVSLEVIVVNRRNQIKAKPVAGTGEG